MNLKSALKSVKLNESTISMILGAIVIIVVGVLIINYFSGQDEGVIIPSIDIENVSLPASHTVAEGEDLWSISEKYYDSGYNWVDIARENNLANANAIEVGQELVIPDVESKAVGTEELKLTDADIDAEPEQKLDNAVSVENTGDSQNAISNETYTVQKGDCLWDIAVRAYGDGYKWTEIAQTNNLSNPDIIHSGNQLTLPR